MKSCNKCLETKPLALFERDRRSKSGFTGICKQCQNARKRINWPSHSEKAKDWKRRNHDKQRSYEEKYRAANREELRASLNRRRSLSPRKDRLESLIRLKLWIENNPGKFKASVMRRRLSEGKATPQWADFDLMGDMYREARYFGLNVDHIVPIRSPKVCGLHWEGNLQLLSKRENSIKSNKFPYQGNDQPPF